MTATETDRQTVPSAPVIAETPEVQRLVRQALSKGSVSLTDLLEIVRPGADSGPDVPDVPRVPELTDAQREALDRIPEVYASVAPAKPRALTPKELASLVEERDTLDVVLGVLTKRKSESLRESLAFHLDTLVDAMPEAERTAKGIVRDAKGHWAAKQDVPAPGTGRKVSRSVSGGKPALTDEAIERAYREGAIDKATWMRITRKPTPPPTRVVDTNLVAEAVKADPSLLFTLAAYADPTVPTTTIKVNPDK